MASPQRGKMALYPETGGFGTANTTSGGVAYQTHTDGTWQPMALHNEAREQYTGSEAPLADSVETVIRGHEGTYLRALRTHGEELWWRGSIGVVEGAAEAVVPASTPRTWKKTYRTAPTGPDFSYTVVQDRFALGTRPSLYKSVYRGAKVRGWSLNIFVDSPVRVSTDFVCPWQVTSGGAAASNAAYPAETGGLGSHMFSWQDVRVRIGPAGTRGTFVIGFLRYLRFRQDNKLDVSRFYTDGNVNLVEPAAFDVNSGGLDLEFDYAAVTDTAILDRYLNGDMISVEVLIERPPYSFRLWLPWIHMRNVHVSGQAEKVATMSVTGDLRHNSGTGDHAVTVDIVSEGSNTS